MVHYSNLIEDSVLDKDLQEYYVQDRDWETI